jgi:glycosyltransferase involved in cell wall biosynthesis
MILGIDAREIQNGITTGIGRALDVFLDYFAEADDENRCVLFSGVPLCKDYGLRVKSIVKKERFTFFWDQVTLSRLIKKQKIDLFFSPYYKIPLFCMRPCISTVFDLMYLYYDSIQPGKTSVLARFYYETIAKRMAHRSAAIYTCSHFTKSQIIKTYAVSPDKIKVIPLGIGKQFTPETDMIKIQEIKNRYHISSGYILYTGNAKPHKNLKTLLAAFKKIKALFPSLELVLAGPVPEQINGIVNNEENSSVICTGKVLENDLPALYSGASVFVMASLYEGFGYPPLEALACGTPVVCSNVSSLPEVVGDAGLLVDPSDAQQMAESVIRVLQSSALAESMIKAGLVRAKEFGAEKTTGRLYELIKECFFTHSF